MIYFNPDTGCINRFPSDSMCEIAKCLPTPLPATDSHFALTVYGWRNIVLRPAHSADKYRSQTCRSTVSLVYTSLCWWQCFILYAFNVQSFMLGKMFPSYFFYPDFDVNDYVLFYMYYTFDLLSWYWYFYRFLWERPSWYHMLPVDRKWRIWLRSD